MHIEEHIRALAHRFWEEEGRPHGRHEEHWERACKEVDLRTLATNSGGGSDANPAGSAALAGAEEIDDGLPEYMGVDELKVGHLSDPSDNWPSTGRSKLAGT